MSKQMSELGLALIKQFEGLRLKAYQDSAGVWTIGYGHTSTARPNMVITEHKAHQLLAQDVWRFERCVNELVQAPLTQNQFDALVSFAFNIGCGALGRSTLLRKLNNAGTSREEVASEFHRWVYAGGRRLRGLERRREAEAELFLTGADPTEMAQADDMDALEGNLETVPTKGQLSAPVVHVRWPEGAQPYIEINNDLRRLIVAYDIEVDAGGDLRVDLEMPA